MACADKGVGQPAKIRYLERRKIMSIFQTLVLGLIIGAILGLFLIIIMIAIVTSEQPPKGDKYDGL